MLFLDQKDISANRQNLEITEGQWEALFLRIDGTDSGSVAKTDVGQILGYIGGVPFLNVDYAHLVHIGNRLFGTMGDTAGTAFDFACLIPCGVPEKSGYINNTMLVERQDKAYLDIPALGTTTGTAKLYGIPSLAPSNYVLEITEKTEGLGGTCVVKPGRENIQFCAIWDAATTDPDKVECEWNGREHYQPSWTDGEIYTNMMTRVETAIDGLWIDFNLARIPAAMRNSDIKLTITGGAGNQDFTFLTAIFTPERAGESVRNVQNSVKEVIRRQKMKGIEISAPIPTRSLGFGRRG